MAVTDMIRIDIAEGDRDRYCALRRRTYTHMVSATFLDFLTPCPSCRHYLIHGYCHLATMPLLSLDPLPAAAAAAADLSLGPLPLPLPLPLPSLLRRRLPLRVRVVHVPHLGAVALLVRRVIDDLQGKLILHHNSYNQLYIMCS